MFSSFLARLSCLAEQQRGDQVLLAYNTVTMPDGNTALLRRQLVGREDAVFHYTHYEYSPMRLPMSELVLEEPVLAAAELRQHCLRTTPLLSLFGLYVHGPSGTTIVRCAGKTSFAVDGTDEYELQDVIVRSRRNELLRAGQCVCGQHYIEGEGDGTEVKAGTEVHGRELVEEIRRLALGGGEWDESQFVPLLPIFLGYCSSPSESPAAVDLSSAGYKRRLRALAGAPAGGRFVFFQERAGRRRRALAQCAGHSVDAAVRHALAYRITGGTFTRRLVRYLCRGGDSPASPVPPRAYAIRGTKRSRLNHVLLRRSVRPPLR